MSFNRFNYQRLVHSIRQALSSTAVFSIFRKPKHLGLLAIILILIFQLVFLQRLHLSKNDNYSKLLVIDETSPTSSHYKYLLKNYGATLPSLSLSKKCDLYFDELYKKNHDWEVMDIGKDANKDYKKEAFNHDSFVNDKINKYKKENEGRDPSDGKKAEFEMEFQKVMKTTLKTEQNMIDAVTHLRVFGNCYLKPDSSLASQWLNKESDSKTDQNFDFCYDVEQRLFPWLSRELPVFERWTGENILGIPKMSDYISDVEYDDVDEPYSLKNSQVDEINRRLFTRSTRSKCFLNTWRKALNGKGIVLSAADKYEKDLIGLIRVLRALNNKLPIQIVHKGDLSEAVKKNLVKHARADDFQVPKYLYEKIREDIPHNFPKQDIWFVNAKRCIRKEFRDKFNMYANKLIAYLFNSFDHILLMDTDSIPLVRPIELFNSGPYKRTETIFFKDRFNREKISKHDSKFFKNLMPSIIDETLFGIPETSNLTLENRYIKDQFRHVMEAGMVGIRRSTHFIGILTSIQINFWEATNSRIWGDKELFWLGQSVAGNEKYEFNKYDVVSVGQLTPMSDRPKNTVAHELCSTHPGHLSGDDDHTLLWINSGMRYCKVDTWSGDMDQERIKNDFKTKENAEKAYKAPVVINAVLIPPGGDRSKPNKLNEPDEGWKMTQPCKGYLWCAYDILGGSNDAKDRGSYIEYDNLTEYKNYYLGKLWLNQDLVDMDQYEQKMKEEREKGVDLESNYLPGSIS